eukprot:6471901-Alexandrium_andersonii.AAC.1
MDGRPASGMLGSPPASPSAKAARSGTNPCGMSTRPYAGMSRRAMSGSGSANSSPPCGADGP